MADEKKTGNAEKSPAVATDSMAAARAARRNNRRSTDHLSDNQKYALRQMQQARSALEKAQKALIGGMTIPATVIDACAKVHSAVGQMLFD